MAHRDPKTGRFVSAHAWRFYVDDNRARPASYLSESGKFWLALAAISLIVAGCGLSLMVHQ